MDQKKVSQALIKCWSIESSSRWTIDCPSRGHCGVTALIIQDTFGGDILKTYANGEPHFYNRLNGKIFDFTSSQFDTPPQYENIESNRQEAFEDTNSRQYECLSKRFKQVYAQD
jgi:hypothetical protein